jgi:phosphate butyryltransferase
LDEVVARARAISQQLGPWPLAVAVAQDRDVLGAVIDAHQDRIVRGMLFGDAEKIRRLAEAEGLSMDGLEVVHIADEAAAARAAVTAANEGRARMLMKGFVKTGELLRLVLAKEFQLRGADLLSHVAVMDVPAYGKLMIITDGGMVVKPSLEEKVAIIRNAGAVMGALGQKRARVALLSMADVVHPGLESTVENAVIGKMGDRRQFGGMVVDGPISFDVAFSEFAARYHHIRTPVAGRTDILVVNSIEEGNILIKSLVIFARARFAGIIVGSRVPICLVSRTDSRFNKKASIALGVVLGHHAQRR